MPKEKIYPLPTAEERERLEARLTECGWTQWGINTILAEIAPYPDFERYFYRHYLVHLPQREAQRSAQAKNAPPKAKVQRIRSILDPASRPHIDAATRWEIWERDDFRCQGCGIRRFLSIDHIDPSSRGGSNEPHNLQTLCLRCNSSKGAR